MSKDGDRVRFKGEPRDLVISQREVPMGEDTQETVGDPSVVVRRKYRRSKITG